MTEYFTDLPTYDFYLDLVNWYIGQLRGGSAILLSYGSLVGVAAFMGASAFATIDKGVALASYTDVSTKEYFADTIEIYSGFGRKYHVFERLGVSKGTADVLIITLSVEFT